MAVSAPTITSISFDKTTYLPGDTITATVNYTQGTSDSIQTLTGTVTDSTTGRTGTLQQTFTVQVKDTTTVSVTDSGNRTWTKASDTGSVAKFTATA
jgi:ribosomal protein L19